MREELIRKAAFWVLKDLSTLKYIYSSVFEGAIAAWEKNYEGVSLTEKERQAVEAKVRGAFNTLEDWKGKDVHTANG